MKLHIENTRETLLPADGSGRNRPAFANGKALTWDANGNLIAKGPVRFTYDFHNRLVRVTEDGVGELASYDYDALNRRISRAVAGEEHPTVWSGWQAIEEYGENGLAARRVYGLGLDEIVRAEVDLDDDGSVETTQRPIYDRIGNLVVLADEAGKPVERYTYKPYGPAKTEADLTPPQLMQIRRSEFGAIEFDSSEALSGEALREALESGAPIDITIDEQPVSISSGDPRPQGLADPSQSTASSAANLAMLDAEPSPHATLTQREIPGRASGRTWALTFDDPVPAGANVTLTFHPAGIQDDFANPLEAPVTRSFIWPDNAAVLLDTAPPEVERLTATFGGVEILFSEPVNSATLLPGVTVDGQTLTWTAAGSEYRYRATVTLPPGPHQVQVNTQLHDLAGTAPAAAANFPFSIPAAGGTIAYEKPDPDELDASAAKNPYGFQGLPRDPETGFLYVRNRYFDPEIGRFVTADPLGFVDGPSEYAFAGNAPVNGGDALGLERNGGLSLKEVEHFQKRRLDAARMQTPLVDPRFVKLLAFCIRSSSPSCKSTLGLSALYEYGDLDATIPFIVGGASDSIPSAIVVNGVFNSEKMARAVGEGASAWLKAPVKVTWNPDTGTLFDLLQVLVVNKPGVVDSSTDTLIREIRLELSRRPTNQPLKVIGHSQGAAIASTALWSLTTEELSRIDLVSLGGAAFTAPPGLHSERFVVNLPDPVAQGFGRGFSFLIGLTAEAPEYIFEFHPLLNHSAKYYFEYLVEREARQQPELTAGGGW